MKSWDLNIRVRIETHALTLKSLEFGSFRIMVLTGWSFEQNPFGNLVESELLCGKKLEIPLASKEVITDYDCGFRKKVAQNK